MNISEEIGLSVSLQTNIFSGLVFGVGWMFLLVGGVGCVFVLFCFNSHGALEPLNEAGHLWLFYISPIRNPDTIGGNQTSCRFRND